MRPLDVFIIAGEESGDALGGPLMQAMKTATDGAVAFRGVGGRRMNAEGLTSLFPMEDLTAIGIGAVVAKLPAILRRLSETVAAIRQAPPDILVLVDAPDFTHRVARRVKASLPKLPVVKYVAPTVWAWRPGRARAMSGSIDHVLALFPFEPEVMRRLGGPPTTYVGHPLLDELPSLRPDAVEAARREEAPPLLLALPGSRRSEIERLAGPFGTAFGRLAAGGRRFELVLPTVPRLEGFVRERVADWPVAPRIISDETEKRAAFRSARAALAASGTVTLELALAAIPTVAAYRLAAWEGLIAHFVLTTGIVTLPNIILGAPAIPEFLQFDCEPVRLAAALEPLVEGGAERQRQLAAFERIAAIMAIGGKPPAERAAATVLGLVGR